MPYVVEILYVISAVLFIFGLKMLSKQKTAVKGNFVSGIGMLLAVIAALVSQGTVSWIWIIVSLLIGAGIGAYASIKVEMTGMPELVALFNGFGGIASVLVAWASFQQIAVFAGEMEKMVGGAVAIPGGNLFILAITVLIGGVTFTGSLIAWAKLSGKMNAKAVMYPGQKIVNAGIIAAILVLTIIFSAVTLKIGILYGLWILLILVSLVFGVLFVIPIGGGDMPVVISLLNSYSGMAACAAGFAVANNVLIVSGALVGSSGIILTNIMCKAMNRSLRNVLFSGFGNATASAGGSAVQGEAKPVSVDDAYLMLEAAQNVLFVPGYGMAVSQAQHAVRELAEQLENNGAEVNFGIHPVAGRMPGHMNVLLAEASVPYEQLKEMDDVNSQMDNVDVAIVIGANDVVNPDARTNETSPLYGMPIINVDQARTVIVLKRSMNPGYAGVENPLFFCDNTRMLLGDAKSSITGLVAQFKD